MNWTDTSLCQFLTRVQFRDWNWRVGDDGPALWLQACFTAADSSGRTSGMYKQRGRKWRVSKYATEAEVVKTCWLAVELALRHEAMEAFTYDHKAIFHPHTPLDALWYGQKYDHDHRQEPKEET